MIGILEKSDTLFDPLLDSIFAYYKFDDDGMKLVDHINGNHLTNSGIAAGETGLKDLAYYFDGINNEISSEEDKYDFVNNNQNKNFTISLWVKPEQINTPQWLIANRIDAANPPGVLLNIEGGNTARFELKDSADNMLFARSQSEVILNEWNHIAARLDGKEMSVWLNGLKTSSAVPDGFILNTENAGITISRPLFSDSYRFKGWMDELGIWDRALSDREIGRLYAGGNGNLINYNGSRIPNITAVSNPSFTPLYRAVTVQFDPSPDAFFYEVLKKGKFFAAISETVIEIAGFNSNEVASIEVTAIGEYGSRSESVTIAAQAEDAPIVTTDGLVSYYKFDESDGDQVIDHYGNFDGVASGGITRGVGGKIGNGFSFNNGEVQTSLMPAIGNAARSFAIWFKTTETGVYQHFIEYGTSGTGQRFTLKVDIFNTLRFEIEGSGKNGSTVVTDGLWHLMVYTHDGSPTVAGSKIYLDNSLEISFTETTAINTGSSSPLAIGMDVVSNMDRYFRGELDELAVYNRELSVSEISALWNQGNGITL